MKCEQSCRVGHPGICLKGAASVGGPHSWLLPSPSCLENGQEGRNSYSHVVILRMGTTGDETVPGLGYLHLLIWLNHYHGGCIPDRRTLFQVDGFI